MADKDDQTEFESTSNQQMESAARDVINRRPGVLRLFKSYPILMFFALVVLVGEVVLLALVVKLPDQTTPLLFGAILLLLVMAIAAAVYVHVRAPAKAAPQGPYRGMEVLIKPGPHKEVHRAGRVIGFTKEMKQHVGIRTTVRKVNATLQTVQLDIDGGQSHWPYEWLDFIG